MNARLSPTPARAIGLAALANFGLLYWTGMAEPFVPGRAFAGLAVAMAAFAVPRAVLPLVAIGALIAGGVAPGDLWPTQWGRLAGSVGDGLDAVFGARIPYEGADADVRLVLGLGGALLAGAAGVAARRHRITALLLLVALYGVPAIAYETGFLGGAAMALLVVLYLGLDRIPQRDLPRAAGLAGAAALLALAAAPALDGSRPWFDYEEFTQETASTRTTEFSWDHDYARLPWPRDGREMIRVQSPRRAYWKVDELDLFDGFRWAENPSRGAPPPPSTETFGVSAANRRRWSFPIAVSVRNLRSNTLPLAGATEGLDVPGGEASMTAPGVWSARRPVRRGDAYRATVYVPEPSRRQLENASGQYPVSILEDLSLHASAGNGRDDLELLVRTFKVAPQLVGYAIRPGADDLRSSNLGRIYGLSRRLLRGARTPYDYVEAVQRHLGDGYTYDETPPRAARTLDGFLFDAKAGFCQQFSGAMALLLRMGGVPARVATGFAPGSFDDRADRYIVRDLDAHSWVEAWFAGIGWVVFDPTPAAAPPRSQASGTAASAGTGDVNDRGTSQVAPPQERKDAVPWSTLVLAALGLSAVAAAGRLLWLHRTGERPPPVSELERALRGAGETLGPATTLTALEARLPAARPYLSALRAQRYATGPPPTAAHRRDLRRALTHGRGLLARARTWLALRPRRD